MAVVSWMADGCLQNNGEGKPKLQLIPEN